MPRRPCQKCRKVFTGSGPRCPDCQADYADRYVTPRTREPWRYVYALQRWRDCRMDALLRDGFQCRALIAPDVRCKNRKGLQGHHTPSLRRLWQLAQGDKRAFEAMACDPRRVLSLCAPHHAQADEQLRIAESDLS